MKNPSAWMLPRAYRMTISGGALASLLSTGSMVDSHGPHNCSTTALATRLHLTSQDSDYLLCGRWCWLMVALSWWPGPGRRC